MGEIFIFKPSPEQKERMKQAGFDVIKVLIKHKLIKEEIYGVLTILAKTYGLAFSLATEDKVLDHE